MGDKKVKRKATDEVASRFSADKEADRAEMRMKYLQLERDLDNVKTVNRGPADNYQILTGVTEKADEMIAQKYVTPREMRLDAKVVKKTATKFGEIFEHLAQMNKQAGGGKILVAEDYALKLCHKMIGHRWKLQHNIECSSSSRFFFNTNRNSNVPEKSLSFGGKNWSFGKILQFFC